MRTNYHTHSTFCDGRNTPEEMVRAAIDLGFDTLGFSSHARFGMPADWTLGADRAPDYVATIRALGAKYKSRIRILCALEADYVPGQTDPDRARYASLGLDYLIGSVHEVVAPDGAWFAVDNTPQQLADGVRDHFGGDARAMIEQYLREVETMATRYDFDIVGHPDLYRKFNAKHPFFREDEPWYVDAVAHCAEVLAASGKIVEVNTGAIGRKWFDDAYPAPPFRRLLREKGVRFVLDSDCHRTDQIDAGFAQFADAERYVDFVAPGVWRPRPGPVV